MIDVKHQSDLTLFFKGVRVFFNLTSGFKHATMAEISLLHGFKLIWLDYPRFHIWAFEIIQTNQKKIT